PAEKASQFCEPASVVRNAEQEHGRDALPAGSPVLQVLPGNQSSPAVAEKDFFLPIRNRLQNGLQLSDGIFDSAPRFFLDSIRPLDFSWDQVRIPYPSIFKNSENERGAGCAKRIGGEQPKMGAAEKGDKGGEECMFVST
ncbi:MAG: hypothetical protein H6Q42_2521, partial [Deltaproteobacteria bacterium]|nr:hypothetical protein [Deltaproteobacteria bacterium]